MNTTFDALTAVGRSVVNVSRPSLTLRSTISGRPGSKNGSSPALSFSIFVASESTQMTLLPKSARQAPETRPTYPVPTTVSVYKMRSFRVRARWRVVEPGSSGLARAIHDPPGWKRGVTLEALRVAVKRRVTRYG